jgi:hypothetical protein
MACKALQKLLLRDKALDGLTQPMADILSHYPKASAAPQSIPFKHPIGDHSRPMLALGSIREQLAQNVGDAFRRLDIIASRVQASQPRFEGRLVNANPIGHQGLWHPRRLKLVSNSQSPAVYTAMMSVMPAGASRQDLPPERAAA